MEKKSDEEIIQSIMEKEMEWINSLYEREPNE